MWIQTCKGMFETPKHKLAALYDKACILLEVPDNIKKSICIIASDIDTDIINVEAGGIEDCPHVTVLYGINKEIDLKKYFTKPLLLKTDNKITYFDNDDASVAKVDIFSPELHELYYTIKSKEANTDTRLDYNPHLTIAYLKPMKRLDNDGFVSFSWVQKECSLMMNGLMNRITLR